MITSALAIFHFMASCMLVKKKSKMTSTKGLIILRQLKSMLGGTRIRILCLFLIFTLVGESLFKLSLLGRVSYFN